MAGSDRALQKTEDGEPMLRKRRSANGAFLSGVSILTVSTLLSKVIGLLYRIPLFRIVGVGGMAYFHAASHIYVTLYLIASAGLPLAVSILVAEYVGRGDVAGAERIYRSAKRIFLTFGLLGSLFLFFFAPWIARRIGLEGAEQSIKYRC